MKRKVSKENLCTVRVIRKFKIIHFLFFHSVNRGGGTNLVPSFNLVHFEISRNKECALVATVRNHASSYIQDVYEVLEEKTAVISEYSHFVLFLVRQKNYFSMFFRWFIKVNVTCRGTF